MTGDYVNLELAAKRGNPSALYNIFYESQLPLFQPMEAPEGNYVRSIHAGALVKAGTERP